MKFMIAVAILFVGIFNFSDCVPTCEEISIMGSAIKTALQGNHGQESFQSKAVRLGKFQIS